MKHAAKKGPDRACTRAPGQRGAPPAADAARDPGVLVMGGLGLAVSAAASLMLVIQHFGGLSLPGCGAGSACAQAAAGPWGKVPGLDWPVSFVGLSYFLGALAAWLAVPFRVSRAALWVARAGAAVSAVYIGVMLVERLFCAYCFASHVGNFVFVIAVELRVRRAAPQRTWQPALASGVFVIATLVLMVLDGRHRAAVLARAEEQRRASEAAMTDRSRATDVVTPVTPAVEPARVFSGRYRWGPEAAAVRIVMLTDYQCPDCRKIEGELNALMERGLSLSVSIKYFPLSIKCNPNAPGDLHANACWAARAAETAGMIGGTESFWLMHRWLFSRGGSFTDAELRQGLAELGFEAAQFERLMQSPETLRRVREDIDEGMSLGLWFTPMIFINGVELKGWNAPQALTRTVESLLATNPPVATAANDRPPLAAERMIADWREQPERQIPESVQRRYMGPDGAKVRVVVFGDYREPFTAEVDGFLRVLTDGPEPRIRYSFAHFPVNASCNPSTQVTKFDSCDAHRAAEAADIVGGPDAFWKTHDWIMSHQSNFSVQGLMADASAWEIDMSALPEAMTLPDVQQRISEDAAAAISLGVQSLPLVFVNGKLVPRWKAGHENLLLRIVTEAAGQ